MSTAVKYFDSEMPSAAALSGQAGALMAILRECLVSGRGLASCTGVVASGVATLTFAATHPYVPLTVALLAGATGAYAALNGERRVISTTSNAISVDATGLPNGAITGSLTAKLAPAGWVEAFTSGNIAAFKSSNASATACFARIDDTGAKNARLRAYSSMTDASTGSDPTPSDAQVSGGLYLSKSNTADATARKWIVVATDSWALINVARGTTYPQDYEATFFGDFESLKSGDAYRFMVIGNTSDLSGNESIGTASAMGKRDDGTGVYIVRGYSQLAGSTTALLRRPGQYGFYSGGSDNPTGPNPVDNGLEVCPTLIYEGGTSTALRRGHLPCIYGLPHYVGAAYDTKSVITAAAGLAGHRLMGVRFGTSTQAAGCRLLIDLDAA